MIENINLSSWSSFVNGGKLDATGAGGFNQLVSVIQEKFNELVAAANGMAGGGEFLVNGEPASPVDGVVTIPSKGRIVLSGTLKGRVVIGTTSDTFDTTVGDPTHLLLDGVTIINDAPNTAAIMYAPEAEKLLVTLGKNTQNFLVCTHEAPREDSQKGALHSENDMIVQGSGYLSCVNHCGHGIKASELRFNGNPHVHATAVHDGIHGNKFLGISGGVFYVDGANDAFGTRAESGTPGTVDYKSPGYIWLFGGEFYAYHIAQSVFESKAQGYIFCTNRVMNVKLVPPAPNTQYTGIVLHTDVAEAKQYNGIAAIDPETYFGAPVVSGATLSGDTYTATVKEVTIKGYFKDKKFVFPIQSSVVTLNGVYIDTSVGHALDYTYDGKNIKFKCEKDTANIIRASGEGNVCLNSINNIACEPKNNSYLMLYSDDTILGSEVTFRDGYGCIISNGDIVGSQINLGETGSFFGGAVMTKSITARLSGKGQKGNLVCTNAAFVGVACTETIASMGLANLGNSDNINYHRISGSSFMGDKGKTYEPYDYIPYGKQGYFL